MSPTRTADSAFNPREWSHRRSQVTKGQSLQRNVAGFRHPGHRSSISIAIARVVKRVGLFTFICDPSNTRVYATYFNYSIFDCKTPTSAPMKGGRWGKQGNREIKCFSVCHFTTICYWWARGGTRGTPRCVALVAQAAPIAPTPPPSFQIIFSQEIPHLSTITGKTRNIIWQHRHPRRCPYPPWKRRAGGRPLEAS